MNRKIFAILASGLSIGAGYVAKADAVSEERALEAFSSINLNGVGIVRIHQGPQSVRVTIDENLIKHYETTVKGDTLNIGFKCTFNFKVLRAIKKIKECEIDITVPKLEKISLYGQGRIESDVYAFDALRVSATGKGLIELRGTAESLTVSSTGDTIINAQDLKTQVASISMTGCGTARIRAMAELRASMTGAGKILYWGSPVVDQKITKGSILRKEGE